MTEKELLKKYGVSLCEFSADDWHRKGFYDSLNHVVYINAALSSKERHKVLLHELGHLEHYGELYKNAPVRHENEANRFMIHELVKEELETYEDSQYFNWLSFAQKYGLKTITDELMIQDEFHKLAGGI